MALNYFRIAKGLSIDGLAVILHGTVDPSAGAGVAAPVGSIYLQTSNGDIWHKINTDDADWTKFVDAAGASLEDGYQNTFMGKTTTGEELPDYTEGNHVADDDTLLAAIDKLDMYLGANPTANSRTNNPIVADGDVNANIEALDDAIGADSELTPVTRTNGPLSLSNSIFGNLEALDTVIGPDSDMDSNVNIDVSQSIYKNLAALDANYDDRAPYKLKTGNTDADPAVAFDTILCNATNGLLIGVEWLVTVRSYATPANITTFKIVAVMEPASTHTLEYTQYAITKVGADIAGLTVDVVFDGTFANVLLMIGATANIDVTFTRNVNRM